MAKRDLAVPRPPPQGTVDLRDAFFEELTRAAETDSRVLVIADDQGALALDDFKARFPGRYFNPGIAEQNIVSIAAGLAIEGWRPVVYGIANFVSIRCLEQIRDDLCAMELPVTIVGSGAGLTYNYDGPTHHNTEDIAAIRPLPSIAVFSPSDARCTANAARASLQRTSGPSYVRLDKGIVADLYPEHHAFDDGFDVLRSGDDVVVVSTGPAVFSALAVADYLAAQGVSAGVVDLYRFKPLDAGMMGDVLVGYRKVVTIEDHSVTGGLGSTIAEVLAERSEGTTLRRFGLGESFSFNYGTRDWLREQEGLDAASVSQAIMDWMTTA